MILSREQFPDGKFPRLQLPTTIWAISRDLYGTTIIMWNLSDSRVDNHIRQPHLCGFTDPANIRRKQSRRDSNATNQMNESSQPNRCPKPWGISELSRWIDCMTRAQPIHSYKHFPDENVSLLQLLNYTDTNWCFK